MKHLYILSIYILTLTINPFLIGQTKAAEQQLYSAMGHPYSLLISRSDKVKIIYSEKLDNISCRVEVNWHEQQFNSPLISVSKQGFLAKPLATCLPRSEAKKLLAKTFS